METVLKPVLNIRIKEVWRENITFQVQYNPKLTKEQIKLIRFELIRLAEEKGLKLVGKI